MQYQDYEMMLEEGDRLFIYTDGVPEATDADNRMFGLEKMTQVLNDNASGSIEQILNGVKAEIDRFVGDAPQFDDLTMLCLERSKNG